MLCREAPALYKADTATVVAARLRQLLAIYVGAAQKDLQKGSSPDHPRIYADARPSQTRMCASAAEALPRALDWNRRC